MDKKLQHMIPKGYLKAWSCPDPPPGKLGTMWVIQKADATRRELRSPKKYFREEERYTLKENGGRNLAVEDALGIIERDFSVVAAKLEASEPLTSHDRVVLSFFAAAMIARTEHFADLTGTMLRTIQAQAAKQAAKKKIEPSLSNAIAEALPNLVGENVRIGMIENSKMIIRMNLSVFVTDDGAGFVTGDEPCIVCAPGDHHSFLGHQDVEFTMPLTPRHLAYYSWKIQPRMYEKWDQRKVDRLNARTIAGCQKEFVSWKGIVRDEWFLAET